MAFIAWYLYNDSKKQRSHSNFFMPIGSKGVIVNKNSGTQLYQVKVRGEIWNATIRDDLEIGDSVEVTDVDDEKLLIQIKATN